MMKIVVAGMLISGAVAYAQLPSSVDGCTAEAIWMDGKPGRQVTVSGLRIPPAARLDGGVTFCIRGVVIKADEATIIERKGERIFSLDGTVTLTMPAR